MKKSLTIENLKSRIGKPVFIASPIYLGITKWNVIKEIAERQDLLYKYLEFIDGLTVTFDKVNDFRFFDTEVSASELKEILESEEKSKKKTGYETVGDGKGYFFITTYMNVTGCIYHCNDSYGSAREVCANHFNDETLTKNLARAECLRYQLRRFAALNGGISSIEDWVSRLDWKYLIAYDYNEQKMYVNSISKFKNFGQIYSKSFVVKMISTRPVSIKQ